MNLTTIIGKVREITGNRANNAAGADLFIDDPVISADLSSYIRELNKIYGNSTGRQRITFNAVASQQEYAFDTYLSTDAYEVIDVWRSSNYVPEGVLDDGTDLLDQAAPFSGCIPIHPGLQSNVMRTISDQARAELAERFSWEVFNRVLILTPVPTDSEEKIRVEFTTTAGSISTLPDEAESALIYAGVVCLKNAVLNRLPGLRVTNEAFGMFVDKQIRLATQQRDYYEARYRSASQSLRGH